MSYIKLLENIKKEVELQSIDVFLQAMNEYIDSSDIHNKISQFNCKCEYCMTHKKYTLYSVLFKRNKNISSFKTNMDILKYEKDNLIKKLNISNNHIEKAKKHIGQMFNTTTYRMLFEI